MTNSPRFPLLLALVVVAMVLHGCDDQPRIGLGAGAFEVTVDPGNPPRYHWSISGAYSVRVAPADAPATLVWGVTDTTGRLASPVVHGTVPTGAVSVVRPATLLRPDTRYRVTITLEDGRTGLQHFRTAPTLR
jgi:hypothetical protein